MTMTIERLSPHWMWNVLHAYCSIAYTVVKPSAYFMPAEDLPGNLKKQIIDVDLDNNRDTKAMIAKLFLCVFQCVLKFHEFSWDFHNLLDISGSVRNYFDAIKYGQILSGWYRWMKFAWFQKLLVRATWDFRMLLNFCEAPTCFQIRLSNPSARGIRRVRTVSVEYPWDLHVSYGGFIFVPFSFRAFHFCSK